MRTEFAFDGSVTTAAPEVDCPLGVVFGDSIELVGYNIWTDQVHRADPVKITFIWRSIKSVSVNYRLAPRIISETDPNVYLPPDHDPVPQTSEWKPGQYYLDEVSFSFFARTRCRPGTYLVQAVLYDPSLPLGRPGRFPDRKAGTATSGYLTLLD